MTQQLLFTPKPVNTKQELQESLLSQLRMLDDNLHGTAIVNNIQRAPDFQITCNVFVHQSNKIKLFVTVRTGTGYGEAGELKTIKVITNPQSGDSHIYHRQSYIGDSLSFLVNKMLDDLWEDIVKISTHIRNKWDMISLRDEELYRYAINS